MPSDVTIEGQSGPLVLLLPGGAETVEGFFPGLVEGLLADPGCRVILYDRPGTGASTEPGLLADAADHLAGVIADLGEGPVVAVGQSLGGATAMLLAAKHPESVAGLVLLDPTPINDAKLCARTESVTRSLARMERVPGLRGIVHGLLRYEARQNMKNVELRPDCRAALDKIADLDLAELAQSVVGLGHVAEEYRDDSLPRIPAIVVTADRKADSAIRQAHVRTAEALGTEIVSWPKAAHAVQLTHPDETLAVVRQVVGAVVARGV